MAKVHMSFQKNRRLLWRTTGGVVIVAFVAYWFINGTTTEQRSAKSQTELAMAAVAQLVKVHHRETGIFLMDNAAIFDEARRQKLKAGRGVYDFIDIKKGRVIDAWGQPFSVEGNAESFTVRSFGPAVKANTVDDIIYHDTCAE